MLNIVRFGAAVLEIKLCPLWAWPFVTKGTGPRDPLCLVPVIYIIIYFYILFGYIKYLLP